jgi:hypothetical protein
MSSVELEAEAEAECQIWLDQQARSNKKVISPKWMSLSLIRCRDMVVCQKTKSGIVAVSTV